jgi:predicted secreted protein
MGAPGLHRWSIEAVSAGRARIGFAYRRPWEAQPVRRHDVVVDIDGER